jgi:hypothetical protein
MRLTDIFRRLVSHFIPSRSATETTEAKQPSPPSPASSGTTLSKPSHAVTYTTTPAKMPGVTSSNGNGNGPAGASKYDQIPGPLGLSSASLQGKVALVTGAGTYSFSRFLPRFRLLRLDLDLHALQSASPPARRTGRQFTPTHVRPARPRHRHPTSPSAATELLQLGQMVIGRPVPSGIGETGGSLRPQIYSGPFPKRPPPKNE